MLKVLLVDDEPFLLEGLKVLINWEDEGFIIVKTASNGFQAVEFLKSNSVDLIIADIKMPEMDGIELLEKVRKEKLSNAFFVILSGYADFNYAQRAIRHNCGAYILKPVKRDDLLTVLNKVTSLHNINKLKSQTTSKLERAYLARNAIALLSGKYDSVNLDYITEHMVVKPNLRYVSIELDSINIKENECEDELRTVQRNLFNITTEYLKNYGTNTVFDVLREDNTYDIGFIYSDLISDEIKVSIKQFFKELLTHLKGVINLPISIFIGKEVDSINDISKSYNSVTIIRSFRGFRIKREIHYYDSESQISNSSNSGTWLCKKSIDRLLTSIEHNDHKDITKSVTAFYNKMKEKDAVGEIMTLNTNYLLFQLIHLASVQDDTVNQEEIFRLISESSFDEGITHGGREHLTIFSCKYSDYLAQLRSNTNHGVLGKIEKYIEENYNQNITLKSLSEMYYVNSAYLGQKFRKKYGCSFKEYLNNYRIEEAAKLLLRTDDKIYQISELVGYHDQDYFIRRFISSKGCTPTKYRKKVCSCT